MRSVSEGDRLWEPSESFKKRSNMAQYMNWLEETRGVSTSDYPELWRWSVENLESFWESIWDYYDIQASRGYDEVLPDPTMPAPRWFSGARLNYAHHVFRRGDLEGPAIISRSGARPDETVTWDQLRERVAAVARSLREMGVTEGDRVVGYLPNVPEAGIAFLATASLGAIWSSCSPDFGIQGVVDRFEQIEPKVLFATDGYRYNGSDYDRRPQVRQIKQALPTLERTVLVPYLRDTGDPGQFERTVHWETLLEPEAELRFESVAFDHPLWILFSSGTTGPPKAIVQGHGGILLEHYKQLGLHQDLGPGDRYLWTTTTGWMMWNYLISGLLVGSTIVTYEGSITHPGPEAMWELVEDYALKLFGTSAPFLTLSRTEGLTPGRDRDLSSLLSIGSTGSPLSPESFQWVYDAVGEDIWLVSASGGTDVCTGFLAGSPLLPVYAGELQCRCLGASVKVFNAEGEAVVDQPGELVIDEPMPSMPIYFWGDENHERYRESYFEMFPGVWRHGDWAKITPRGTAVIYGRSDATINRRGVRMGTGEIYRVLEDIEEIADSIIVHLGQGEDSYLPLFVVLKEGVELDDALREKINGRIRDGLTPRHVPDEITEIAEVPRTLSGKKMEVPVKRILSGEPVEDAANPDSMENPDAIRSFEQMRSHDRFPASPGG